EWTHSAHGPDRNPVVQQSPATLLVDCHSGGTVVRPLCDPSTARQWPETTTAMRACERVNDEAIVSRRSEGNFNSTVDTEIVTTAAGESCDRVHHRADICRNGGGDTSSNFAVGATLTVNRSQNRKQGGCDLRRHDRAARTDEVVLSGRIDERAVRTAPEPEWIPQLSAHAPGQAVEVLSVNDHRD